MLVSPTFDMKSVLLPWLAGGRLLPEALAKTGSDPRAPWRTPCRSGGSSAYKSLWEAVRYLLLHAGLNAAQLKQLSFNVRRCFLDAAARDLDVMLNPAVEFVAWKTGAGPAARPLRQILASGGPLLTAAAPGAPTVDLAASPMTALDGKVVALYFSGHWCGPCQQFTPQLKQFYINVKREGKPFEIVFVSHDRSPQEFSQYFGGMPWHAVPYTQAGRAAAQELVEAYQVSGIPTLVFFKSLGTDDEQAEVITSDGRKLVAGDPEGQAHPWHGSSAGDGDGTGDGAGGAGEGVPQRTMSSADLRIVRFACEQTSRAACKERAAGRLSLDGLRNVQAHAEQVLVAAAALPPGPDVIRERASMLPPLVALDGEACANVPVPAFSNMELLKGTGMDQFAGLESQNNVTELANMLEVPEKVSSVDQALVALLRCESVVDALLKRAGDASASSRLVSQHQIIELIGKLFTRVLPTPRAATVARAFERAQEVEAQHGAVSDDEDEPGGDDDPAAGIQADAESTKAVAAAAIEAAKQKAAAALAAQQAQKAADEAAKEAAQLEARQTQAMTLLAAWPHLDFDVVVGALEVNGDSMSIAGNWLLDKDNATARQMIASKRATNAAKRAAGVDPGFGDSASKSDLGSGGSGGQNVTAEDLANGATDQLGPDRGAAAAFRRRLVAEEADVPCMWSTPMTRENQLRFLIAVYKLLSTFGGMWQAIELPSRPFDAERTCVTMCALSLFDAVLRMPASDRPLIVSSLLSRDGGYALSTAVCQDNRPLDDMSSTMQLHQPWAHVARARALAYLSAMRRSCAKTLFLFRQPQKIELRKYSSTCVFLKRLLARCGIPLIPRDARRPPPEIEALCNWLFEPGTKLAQQHPEFGLARDMCALSKFLLTMQTREHELMSRRQEREGMRFMNYSFTFEEGGRKSSWDLRHGGLRWEVVGFRGAPDKDTADVDCFGFGNRRLFFGEGVVCHSPADAEKAVQDSFKRQQRAQRPPAGATRPPPAIRPRAAP